MKGLDATPYKGVRDFYPDDWARLQALFKSARTVLTRAGYEEYNASPMERAELYESKTSEEIVSDQTYTFTDRGDRRVTLRPEMTPTLARMIAAKGRELPLPQRWFSIGNRFRYERPQRGRLREFYQVDVDLVGVAGVEADIEIIQLASQLLVALGATERDFVIRVSSRKLLQEACAKAGLSEATTRQYLRLLDKKDKMSEVEFDAARKELTATDPLSLVDGSEMESFVAALAERGIGNAVFDPTITRGFDYYTGMVFEVFDTDPENTRALFGGGRYDNLLALFGGNTVPAVGFGMGEVPVFDFLLTHGLFPSITSAPRLYLGTPDQSDLPAAQTFAESLREKGVSVFVNLTDRSLGDQVKDAVKREIPYFAAYGREELSTGTVRLKQLATSSETELSADTLATHLATL